MRKVTKEEVDNIVAKLDKGLVERFTKCIPNTIEQQVEIFCELHDKDDDIATEFTQWMKELLESEDFTEIKVKPRGQMIPLKVLGRRVGQVDSLLLKEVAKRYPVDNLTKLTRRFIETQILYSEITSIDDIEAATRYVNNMFYHNIGEYMTDYLRKKIWDELLICQSCSSCVDGYCITYMANVHPFNTCRK